MQHIIAGCKSGNRLAQKQIFEAYNKGMLLLCTRYVKDMHVAEEMLLNGFCKFFSSIERFEYKGDQSVSAWLKKIMVNECLMFLRDKKRLLFLPEEKAEEITLNEAVLEKLNADTILKLIEQLPDGYRMVFNLYVVEGYTHSEIAQFLQISEGTSKSQLSKARQFLQKLLPKEMVYER